VGLNACRVAKARIGADILEMDLERLGHGAPAHRTPLARSLAETLVLRARGVPREGIRVRIDGRDLGILEHATLSADLPLPPAP
jgi:hypothetical protein